MRFEIFTMAIVTVVVLWYALLLNLIAICGVSEEIALSIFGIP